jgi:serine/threonine protein kinase
MNAQDHPSGAVAGAGGADGLGPTRKASATTGEGWQLAGRYLLVEQIGHGGMGTVWRARDQLLDREVAVKELGVSGLPQEELAVLHLRMQQEARAAARIKHPGVITVFDVLQESGRPWIVMELIDGQSLADVIATEGTLLPRDAARVGAQVLAALDRAHQLGVLHRDVKPANVLLERSGRVVLTDFGIALFEGSAGLTRTGDIVGSPDYLAPERAMGHRPGPESDLWSLGATLYAEVEGQSPFSRTSTLSTLQAVISDPLPEPRHAGLLAPVIEALLRKDPNERPTAAQAQRMIEEVATGQATDLTTPGPQHPPTQVVTHEDPDSTAERSARYPMQSTPLSPHETGARPKPSQAGAYGDHQGGTPPTEPSPYLGGTSDGGRRRRNIVLIALAVALVAALVGGLTWTLTSKGGSGPSTTVPDISTSGHPPGSASASQNRPAAADQAKSLDQLLDRSADSRRMVVSAVNATQACTSPASVSAATGTLRDAAEQRSALISELNALDLSQVPGSADATTKLRAAWQHSADADSAYAAWAAGMEKGGCTPGSAPHDSNWRAGSEASAQATSAKNAFIEKWNPIAKRYGLPTRASDRI